jgi:hypothetical protein
MKRNRIYLTIGAVIVFISQSSFGQTYTQCKTVDFAELQTFNKEELARNFCKNTAAKNSASEAITENIKYQTDLLKIAQDYTRIKSYSKSNEILEQVKGLEGVTRQMEQNIANCWAENDRVLRALTAKNTKIENCTPLTLANINEQPKLDPLIEEYCQLKNEVQKQLDLGNSFVKELGKLNSIKEKLNKKKVLIPASCPK